MTEVIVHSSDVRPGVQIFLGSRCAAPDRRRCAIPEHLLRQSRTQSCWRPKRATVGCVAVGTFADRGHGNVREACRIDQIHIDETKHVRQLEGACACRSPGLAYPESLLRQPQRGTEAAIEQPPRLGDSACAID